MVWFAWIIFTLILWTEKFDFIAYTGETTAMGPLCSFTHNRNNVSNCVSTKTKPKVTNLLENYIPLPVITITASVLVIVFNFWGSKETDSWIQVSLTYQKTFLGMVIKSKFAFFYHCTFCTKLWNSLISTIWHNLPESGMEIEMKSINAPNSSSINS